MEYVCERREMIAGEVRREEVSHKWQDNIKTFLKAVG
jgi:hypothetical protein